MSFATDARNLSRGQTRVIFVILIAAKPVRVEKNVGGGASWMPGGTVSRAGVSTGTLIGIPRATYLDLQSVTRGRKSI